jgi:16S rRNA (cytosine1402-N4)-methyltransferase
MNSISVNQGNEDSPSEHIAVLIDKIAELISLPTDGAIVDATLGHGGHSLMFGQMLGPDGTILGIDIDKNCIGRAQSVLSNLHCKVILVRENFRKIAEITSQQGIEKVDLIFADLGFCSAQICDPGRGLSFQENMPLDMRLDDRLAKTAADIVNTLDEKALADLIYEYGEDRASRRIARFIVNHRKSQRITTTAQLAAIVSRALPRPPKGPRSRIHPATRTFQALRIAVNDELGAIKELLDAAPQLLKNDAAIAVISFHSLEDRIVKWNFKQNAAKGIYEILTKKPIIASRDEIQKNPRARSAKLRIARKTVQ